MNKERWFYLDIKNNKLQKIEFGDLPTKSGHIFLRYERNEVDSEQSAVLELYSPFGVCIRHSTLDGSTYFKPIGMKCNKKLVEIQKIAQKLNRGKNND